ncbi:hypothetical protein [Candidatus Solirubrobacter pratensis]|uniref:hypothetical protein n=1 Tax=Candidatus Solirubrobacter pratensis TaxID=1298857 RepID=UPI000485EF75|nr:hypothetical protein [Candidatus Solirubrobacter pratensis]
MALEWQDEQGHGDGYADNGAALKFLARTLGGRLSQQGPLSTIRTPRASVEVALHEDVNSVTLDSVIAEPEGTGEGTKLVEALKQYAERTGKQLHVSNIANEGFFNRFPWLDVDRDGALPQGSFGQAPVSWKNTFSKSAGWEEYPVRVSASERLPRVTKSHIGYWLGWLEGYGWYRRWFTNDTSYLQAAQKLGMHFARALGRNDPDYMRGYEKAQASGLVPDYRLGPDGTANADPKMEYWQQQGPGLEAQGQEILAWLEGLSAQDELEQHQRAQEDTTPGDLTFPEDWNKEGKLAAHGLIPCPYCGGDIQYQHDNWGPGPRYYQCAGCRHRWPDTEQALKEIMPKGIDCPQCGSEMHWRDGSSLGRLYPDGAWECSQRRCWHMQRPGEGVPNTVPDMWSEKPDDTFPEDWTKGSKLWAVASDNYSWDTEQVELWMDNDEPTYTKIRKLFERGMTLEQFESWCIRNIIGPLNKQQIADAREWNEIPEDQRVDHLYEDLKNKSQEAADFVDSLGMGKDVGDTEPNLIDPDKVNWQELWDGLYNEINENSEYEREMARIKGMGLGWGTNGADDDTNRLRDALYRYHGAVPGHDEGGDERMAWDDPRAYHRRNVNVPYEDAKVMGDWPEQFISLDTRNAISDHHYNKMLAPYLEKARGLASGANTPPEHLDEMAFNLMRRELGNAWTEDKYDFSDPEVKRLTESDPGVQKVMQNGYNMRLHDYTNTLMHGINMGTALPHHVEVARTALQQRGYSEQDIQRILQQKYRWDAELRQRIPVAPDHVPPKPPSPDDPGDLTLPEHWGRTIPSHRHGWADGARAF